MTAAFGFPTPDSVARRLEFSKDTVTLESVRDTFTQLSRDANADNRGDLPAEAHEAAVLVEQLIASGEPRGLADSARQIADVESLIRTTRELRDSTAEAYSSHNVHTTQVAEALEILTAYGVLLLAADLDMRESL